MAHLGILRDYRFSDSEAAGADIRGASVYGIDDDKLGKIDDVIFDHASADIKYVVIDTGGWLSSKKFVVPAERLRASAKHEDDFEVGLDKSQVEKFPPYNEEDVESSRRWADYEGRYRSKWASGPVMHREATDRNITPTTAQMTEGTGATGNLKGGVPANSETLSGARTAEINSRIIPPTYDEVRIESGPNGIGPRWSNFADRLRERRKEVVTACVACGQEPSSFARGDDRKAS
jgi:sporulation protein YlmC with PRC-barrel domain